MSRIDVHRHIFAPPYVAQLRELNIGLPGWGERTSATSTLDDMDEGGVTTAILSTPYAPRSVTEDPVTLRQYCRVNNDYVAGLMAEYPGRFGLFASLPLPDVQGSIDEIEYSFEALGADGVRMNTNCGTRWIADQSFAPVFEELNRRHAVVYTHPVTPTCCSDILSELEVNDAVIEFGTDTARAVLQIVFGGVAARFSNINFIFSHGGGTMPALVERFVNLAASRRFAPQFPNGFLEVAGGFYYDTAQATNRAAMSALNAVVPDSQILFGTDFPWRTTKDQVDSLESNGLFSNEQLRGIDYGNAVRLLPRLAVA
jgi:predicted TIM-barrel fold metal-dependent hydrolase